MTDFLPGTMVTTIIWADDIKSKDWSWTAAQGDDLKRRCATIEINFIKIAQQKEASAIAEEMVKEWLLLYLMLATRQDLINKGVRGKLSGTAESSLCKTNFDVVMASPELLKQYSDIAIRNLRAGRWIVGNEFEALTDDVTRVLLSWLHFSEAIDACVGKCYICGKPVMTGVPKEDILAVVETPYASIKPSPFIDTIVWICKPCVPLAKDMGLEAKPFEIKTEGGS